MALLREVSHFGPPVIGLLDSFSCKRSGGARVFLNLLLWLTSIHPGNRWFHKMCSKKLFKIRSISQIVLQANSLWWLRMRFFMLWEKQVIRILAWTLQTWLACLGWQIRFRRWGPCKKWNKHNLTWIMTGATGQCTWLSAGSTLLVSWNWTDHLLHLDWKLRVSLSLPLTLVSVLLIMPWPLAGLS